MAEIIWSLATSMVFGDLLQGLSYFKNQRIFSNKRNPDGGQSSSAANSWCGGFVYLRLHVLTEAEAAWHLQFQTFDEHCTAHAHQEPHHASPHMSRCIHAALTKTENKGFELTVWRRKEQTKGCSDGKQESNRNYNNNLLLLYRGSMYSLIYWSSFQ